MTTVVGEVVVVVLDEPVDVLLVVVVVVVERPQRCFRVLVDVEGCVGVVVPVVEPEPVVGVVEPVVEPEPVEDVSEPPLILADRAGETAALLALRPNFMSSEFCRLRLVSLANDALSLIWILTVRMSPTLSARESLNSAA